MTGEKVLLRHVAGDVEADPHQKPDTRPTEPPLQGTVPSFLEVRKSDQKQDRPKDQQQQIVNPMLEKDFQIGFQHRPADLQFTKEQARAEQGQAPHDRVTYFAGSTAGCDEKRNAPHQEQNILTELKERVFLIETCIAEADVKQQADADKKQGHKTVACMEPAQVKPLYGKPGANVRQGEGGKRITQSPILLLREARLPISLPGANRMGCQGARVPDRPGSGRAWTCILRRKATQGKTTRNKKMLSCVKRLLACEIQLSFNPAR